MVMKKMSEVLAPGHEDQYEEALRLFEEEMDEIEAPVAAYRKALKRAIAKMNEMLEASMCDGPSPDGEEGDDEDRYHDGDPG